MNICIINGPNLNLLGKREESHYGSFSLTELQSYLTEKCPANISLTFFQENSEGAIIDYIQNLKNTEGIVLNAAAYTHTSIGIRDALLAKKIPFIEVHISNVFKREEFRQKSFLSDIAIGIISGLGKTGYLAALQYFQEMQ